MPLGIDFDLHFQRVGFVSGLDHGLSRVLEREQTRDERPEVHTPSGHQANRFVAHVPVAEAAHELDFAHHELVFGIHSQNANRCPANGRLANQVEASPLPVVFPAVAPRMEQFRHALGLRANAGQVRSIVQVASNARQSEILQIVRAAMDLGDDVIDVQRCQ